jgi:hypothetical protein
MWYLERLFRDYARRLSGFAEFLSKRTEVFATSRNNEALQIAFFSRRQKDLLPEDGTIN